MLTATCSQCQQSIHVALRRGTRLAAIACPHCGDGRSGTPLPGPALATRTWALHHIVSATASETARLIGERLPDAPTSGHGSAYALIRKCRSQLEDVSSWLATSAAAIDYAAADNR